MHHCDEIWTSTFYEDLVRLLLRDALDLLEISPRRVGHRLDGIVAAIYDELDVALGEAAETLYSGSSSGIDSIVSALAMETHLKSCQRRGRTRASHALIARLRLIVFLLCLGHFSGDVCGRFSIMRD